MKRWIVAVAAIGVGFGMLAGWMGSRLEPVYEVNAGLLVGPTSGTQNTLRASGQLALTYAEIARSRSTVDRTLTSMGVDPASLDVEVEATANDVTRLVSITVRAADPDLARLLAKGLSEELSDVGEKPVRIDPEDRELGGPATVIRPEGLITVIEEPTQARAPSNPVPNTIGILVGLAAGLVAISILIWREHSNPTVSDLDDLRALGCAHVATISSRTASVYRPNHSLVEAISLAPLAQMRLTRDRSVALMVSPSSRYRRGIETSIQLTLAISIAGSRTCLVDDDPTGRRRRQLERSPGPLRASDGSPDTVLATSLNYDATAMRSWIGELKPSQLIVVAVPALEGSGIARAWLSVADQLVFIASQDRTTMAEVRQVVDGYRQASGRPPIVLLDSYDQGRLASAFRTRRSDLTQITTAPRELVAWREPDADVELVDLDDAIDDAEGLDESSGAVGSISESIIEWAAARKRRDLRDTAKIVDVGDGKLDTDTDTDTDEGVEDGDELESDAKITDTFDLRNIDADDEQVEGEQLAVDNLDPLDETETEDKNKNKNKDEDEDRKRSETDELLTLLLPDD